MQFFYGNHAFVDSLPLAFLHEDSVLSGIFKNSSKEEILFSSIDYHLYLSVFDIICHNFGLIRSYWPFSLVFLFSYCDLVSISQRILFRLSLKLYETKCVPAYGL